MSDPQTESDGPPRLALIAALVLAVAAVGAVLAIAATRRTPPPQPLVLAAVPAPHAADPACAALLDALPQRFGDYQRTDLAQPAPAGAAAWRGDGEPVVLRCGLDRPTDFVVGSPIQVVGAVQWYQARSAEQPARSTWYTVDRPVYVALTLPPGSGPTPIQQLSALIDKAMPAVPINPAPVS